MQDRNDAAYWLPRLEQSGVPVPKTRMVTTDLPLVCILDGEECPELTRERWDGFIAELVAAAHEVGGPPVFLRTGHGSGKHEWRETCHVTDLARMNEHAGALIEWSACADFYGLPTSTWLVREFLELEHDGLICDAYGGMPVAREWRYFVDGGRRLCGHAYWPEDAVEDGRPNLHDWRELLAAREQAPVTVDLLAQAVADAFADDGAWSVDIAVGVDGRAWVIDMAEMARSFHWPDCPVAEAASDG